MTLTSPLPGETFDHPATITLSATATQQGGGSIKFVKFFADAVLLATDKTAPYQFVWTGASIGTHVLFAQAKGTGQIGTSPTVTVTVTEPPPPSEPDYVVESPSISPASPEAGQSLTSTATVRNQGAGDATSASSTSLGLDLGDDGITDLIFPAQTTPGLGAGATAEVSFPGFWVAEIGTHRLEICADSTDAISESDETNDCTSLVFTVTEPPPPAQPDYVLESLAIAPPSPETGQTIGVSATVRNQGTGGATSASSTSLSLDLGDDGTTDVTFPPASTSALGASSFEPVTFPDVWVAESGVHRITVCADSTDVISESDETNDCTSLVFTVTEPPPPGSFTCTTVIGFSQTFEWFQEMERLEVVPDDTWQLRWHSGAQITAWAQVEHPYWYEEVDSPCTEGSNDPDRVILTISGSESIDWALKTSQAIDAIRFHYPNAQVIRLQAVVGGPDHQVCPWPTDPFYVRASFNHPNIDAAIATLVGNGVSMGAHALVPTCAEYFDQMGHLTDDGEEIVAQAVGAWYMAGN